MKKPSKVPFVPTVSFAHDAPTLTPDPYPGPSSFGNSPFTNTAIQQPNAFGQGVMGSVDELVAIAPHDTQLTPQGPVNDLMQLRADYPFLPIMPFPGSTICLFLAANVAQEIIIPAGASFLMLRGSADYYCCTDGRAKLPTTSAEAETCALFFAPEGCAFYCGGLRSISIVSPFDATIVTVAVYFPRQYPEA